MSSFFCDPKHPDEIPVRFDPVVSAGLRREYLRHETRRQFFGKVARGLGGAALSTLLGDSLLGAMANAEGQGLLPAAGRRLPHIAPKAKRAIYLVMAGGPSQLDTWDYKPGLQYNVDLPKSLLGGGDANLGMGSQQARYPVAPSIFKFRQHGRSGIWASELLPWTSKIVDDLAVIQSMHTDSVNHDPAITHFLTGNTIAGKPSMGAWISYGLGSANENLPTFVVLTSRLPGDDFAPQALFSRLWGSGFLPPSTAGVALRSDGGDPVLYIKDPPSINSTRRRLMLDGIQKLNQSTFAEIGDPEIHARIEQYEMAFRMQTSVPELTDLSSESAETFELYGPKSRIPGTFAHNCLLARRMAERGVRFTQIFHRGWDSHDKLPSKDSRLCADIDQPCYALITDLKRRGLLDDTLVVWGGEFGRTVYCQGALTPTDYGRDHHPLCFTMWAAGGGLKAGFVYGQTDDFSYKVARDPVHVRDLHATILHQLGLEHERLTFKFQGLEQKLTGTTPAKVIDGLIA
ncbi:MAG: DUF1501 domain-containing protein [Opitutus sp.]|nr:DUF1501 domain-containing protein [Opitutus sp.]